MIKIKIADIPKDQKISREEMKRAFGGAPFSRKAYYGMERYIDFYSRLFPWANTEET